MRYLVVPLVILIVFIIAYLGQLNPGKVTLYLARDVSREFQITSLILFSAVIGATFVIIGSGIRETKNLFLNWKYNRLQKKEAKIEELYTEAVNAYLAKRFRDALALFQKVLALNPSHVNALLGLGKIHRKEGNYAEAIRLHRKARGLDEQNVEVLLSLSRDLEEAHRLEEATQYLKEVLRTDESNLTALTRLRNLYIKLLSWEEAHRLQERLIKLPVADDDRRREISYILGIKYELGRHHLDRGEKEVARRYFKGAIKISKDFLPAYIGLGETHLREGKAEMAVALWEKAYRITRNIILLHKLEDLYLEMGNPGRIIQFYRQIVEEDPQNLIVRFYLGKLYYRLEMVDHAFDVLAEVDAHTDHFPDLQKILGNLFLRRGDLEKAIETFKKGLNLKKRVLVPYYCPHCDYHTIEWSGRCVRCGRWNTYEATPIITDRGDRKGFVETTPIYLYPAEGNHGEQNDAIEVAEGAEPSPEKQQDSPL
jgi:lipopolysaccharide biosynthesis regulator YciM